MVPPAQVPRYYALADAFVSASTSEAQGLTYIEALAAGLPLLCRADPCVEALIRPGEGGWVYHNAREFTALARALPTGAAAQSLRQAARRAAAPYTREVFGQSVEGLYFRALQMPRARPLLPWTRKVIVW